MALPEHKVTTIFGRSGSGKTRRLMEIEQQLSNDICIRVGAETLIDDIYSGISNSFDNTGFVSRCRRINTLLIDNLWTLASRPQVARVVIVLLKERATDNLTTILASDIAIDRWSVTSPDLAQLIQEGEIIRLDRRGVASKASVKADMDREV